MSKDRIDSVVGKRGLFMCRIASLFLLQRLKGSTSGYARDFNNIGARAVIKIFFFARQGPEGNSRHSERNIRGTCTIVCHPPYSPDLAPSDYNLFLGLKKQLKGRHFSSEAEVIAAAETWLDRQPSEFFFFWSGFQKLQQRTRKCTELRGEYFE